MTFERLFSPLDIGPITLKNRIVSSGHDTMLESSGRVTPELIAYHRARAAGGVGLIVLQVFAVAPSARYTASVLDATTDDVIPGLTELVVALRPYGVSIGAQLFHPGREIIDATTTRPAAVAPSAVPTERFAVMPRALSTDEVAELVAAYAEAAARLALAGVDALEIVASHGYLPAQFLSPVTNLRNDAYGGDPERCRRFLGDVLDQVRLAAPDVALGLRVSLDDAAAEGADVGTTLAALEHYDSLKAFDYLSVTTGSSSTHLGATHIAPDMGFAPGYVAPLAAKAKRRLSVPVMVAGRFNQPQEAERALADGSTDAVIMTRALISDPDLPNKTAAGDLDAIRACVGCLQACIGHFHLGLPVSCIHRPESGRELRFGTISLSSRRRRALVIGAGPAGLKAATTLALRGHHVDVLESASQPGGQVTMAARLLGRAEFAGVTDNLWGALRDTSAVLHLDHPATADDITRFSPDLIVLAHGSRPWRPAFEVLGDPVILDATEVINAPAPEGPVVVIDTRGDLVGPLTALDLYARGCLVTYVHVAPLPAYYAPQYLRERAIGDLTRARFECLAYVRLVGVDSDTVFLQHTLTGEVLTRPCANLVLAVPREAAPAPDLGSPEISRILIGDARSPRTVEEAVLDGLELLADV